MKGTRLDNKTPTTPDPPQDRSDLVSKDAAPHTSDAPDVHNKSTVAKDDVKTGPDTGTDTRPDTSDGEGGSQNLTPREQQLARARARRDGTNIAPISTQETDTAFARPAASPARVQRRHIGLIVFFIQAVIFPTLIAGWYLFYVAQDQYASHLGFSVRKEESGSAIEILGGITELSGSSSSDTDILFEFIQSQNIVRAVNARVDLVDAYTRDGDPVFTLGDDTRIEALSDYWRSVVNVFYDRSSGLIEIRVKAFDPQTASAIAEAIYLESSLMINDLSTTAQEDATRYAEQELEDAVERLKLARGAITAFRNRTQIVDPQADIQGRMGLLNTLQAQLANALIELDLTRQASTRDDDPRVVQGQRRVEVIQDRIRSERERFSEGNIDNGGEAYSELVGEYEALAVDQEFAEQAYIVALATFNSANAEAQRQSRYLASYIDPTLAETAEYPRRFIILLTIFGTLLIGFSVLTMIYYSLRDRR